jgi:hypothetical protein
MVGMPVRQHNPFYVAHGASQPKQTVGKRPICRVGGDAGIYEGREGIIDEVAVRFVV